MYVCRELVEKSNSKNIFSTKSNNMKKFTFLLVLFIICTSSNYAQCLTAPNGQFPTTTFNIPGACDAATQYTIIADCWAGEYSLVAINIGETYEFNSGILFGPISTDYITISDETGTTAFAFGTTPVTWTSNFTGNIRFYTHKSSGCEAESFGRARSVICGAGLLSNKDISFQDFEYYPNPVEGNLSLRAQETIDQVIIYNMIGQEVFKAFPNTLSDEINVSNLSKGAYFMNVKIKGASENFKLIKN